MYARAARALASLDVGQGSGCRLDLFQVFVADAHTLGVRGQGIEIERHPA